jgi:hypothetical protein
MVGQTEQARKVDLPSFRVCRNLGLRFVFVEPPASGEPTPMNEESNLDTFACEALPIDPGFRDAVLILRRGGIEIFESSEGRDGDVSDELTIKFHGSSLAGYKAFAIARQNGLAVRRIQRAYGVVDGQLGEPWWEIIMGS